MVLILLIFLPSEVKLNMKKTFLILLSIFVIFYNTIPGQYKIDSKVTKVLIETSSGKIVVILYNETPLHRDNFIKLVKEGFYDNQLFHRVIKDFMIQGGDPDSKNAAPGVMLGKGSSKYTVQAEIKSSYYHKKGALAAARMGDEVNPRKSSSGSQFYIIQGTIFTLAQLNTMVKQGRHYAFTPQQVKDYTSIGGAPHLDGSYTVFGEVISGIEVIDKIANSPVDQNDRPSKDIRYTMKIIK